jgi:hypothetical protein
MEECMYVRTNIRVYFVWYVYMNGCTHECMHVNCREISQTQARTSPLRYATNKGSFFASVLGLVCYILGLF